MSISHIVIRYRFTVKDVIRGKALLMIENVYIDIYKKINYINTCTRNVPLSNYLNNSTSLEQQ